MRGGTALTGRSLASPPPPGPAPGVVLDPPFLNPGDTRFGHEQKLVQIWCNGCGMGPKTRDQGTWQDSAIQDMLAQNREEAYRQGRCCRWLRSRCWAQQQEDLGIIVPDGRKFAARLKQWKAEEAQEKQDAAAQGLVKAPRTKRRPPLGLCQVSPTNADADAPLAVLLLGPVG